MLTTKFLLQDEETDFTNDNSEEFSDTECGSCVTDNQVLKKKIAKIKLNKIVRETLPQLQKSVFLNIISAVFFFYMGAIVFALFLLLTSIWL